MKFDKEKFFASMRAWGALKQGQVDGLNVLLDGFESDAEMADLRWIAYALATVKHETANTYRPIAEYGKGRGRPYGKKDPETGQTYYGRGYVQLTWRNNYAEMSELTGVDLVNQPDLAMQPDIAYQVLSEGMRAGTFTGHKLGGFINATKCDYLHARKIINAMDKAELIAGYAERFESILKDAEAPEEAPRAVSTTTTTTTETPPVTTVVEEKTVIPAKAKEIVGTGLSTIGNRIATGGISGGVISAIGAFVEKAWPVLIFAAFLITTGVIIWLVIYHNQKKDKRVEASMAANPDMSDIKFVKPGKKKDATSN